MWGDANSRLERPRRCAVALLWLIAAAGCASHPPTLTLDLEGGEAWTFTKLIAGVAPEGECERVVVRSDRGAIDAAQNAGRFQAQIPLQPGPNSVSAECVRGARVLARSSPQSWALQLVDRPKAWIRLRTSGESVWLDAGQSELAPSSPAPLTRFEWSSRSANPAPLVDKEGQPLGATAGRQIELAAPRAEGDYVLTLRVTDALGRTDEAAAMFRVAGGQAREVDASSEHPGWVDRVVVYGAAPFFFERGFEGLRERLDEIAALGATAVWLSPIAAAASGDFGYAVVDHFRLRPEFGDDAAFRALVQRAHALGLKVMLDFVPNHAASEHRYFLDAERNGPSSPYFGWFDRDEHGEVTHYFDWAHLQNFEYDNPEVQNHVIEAFVHWVRAYDVDGFRVDASWAVRERAPEFWPRWRAELKRIEPDLFLLAEASARDPYYFAHGFDAAYDWTNKLGEWAWRDVFVEGRVDVPRLRAALAQTSGGADALTFRFLNNNDTGPRFVTRHGPALAKLAATLLFTLPGVPMIYNGDEVGAAFEPYDEGPVIDWRDPHGLSAHYAQIIRLRAQHEALRGRELELLDVGAEDSVLAFRRPGERRGDDVFVYLNFEARARDVRLPGGPRAPEFEDLLTGTALGASAGAGVTRIAGRQALVLKTRGAR